MYYIAVLIVCTLQPGFMGDKDTGATCLRFTDSTEVHYHSLELCSQRIRELVDAVSQDQEQLNRKLPPPWHYRGRCEVPVIDEKIA